MEVNDISLALQTYFDVMYECDLEKFDLVFHPTCSLFTMKNGELNVRPHAKYRAEIAERTPPKRLSQPRMDAILQIAVLSPEIAFAQVRVRLFEKVFIDNLNLLKFDERWMIVAKIFHHAETIEA